MLALLLENILITGIVDRASLQCAWASGKWPATTVHVVFRPRLCFWQVPPAHPPPVATNYDSVPRELARGVWLSAITGPSQTDTSIQVRHDYDVSHSAPMPVSQVIF